MNKWGVRLIGLYFFVWAISDIYKLIIGTSSKKFLGFYFAIGDEYLVFMSVVEIVFLVYIGFQLFRFHQSGRYGALVVFCLHALEAGGFLIWTIIIMTKPFFDNDPRHLYDMTIVGGLNPITYLLLLVGAFAYYFIPAYYLMRKDVKQLFEKPVRAGETN